MKKVGTNLSLLILIIFYRIGSCVGLQNSQVRANQQIIKTADNKKDHEGCLWFLGKVLR